MSRPLPHALPRYSRLICGFVAVASVGFSFAARADEAADANNLTAPEPSAAQSVQTAAASSDFPEHPGLTGEATLGDTLAEDRAGLTYAVRLDSNPVGPLWITGRMRVTGAVDKADLTLGYVLHSYYGDGSEGFNMKTGETNSKVYYNHYETAATERNVWVLAVGARGFVNTTWDKGHDSNILPDHTKAYLAAQAGLQYHNDSSLGAHRVYEAYAVISQKGVGEVVGAHTAFGFLPWLVLGGEFGHMKLEDTLTNTYFIVEAGVSWGH